jgi:hypothetical protein
MVQTNKDLHRHQTQQETTTNPHQPLQHAIGSALFFNELMQLHVALILAVLQKVMHQTW